MENKANTLPTIKIGFVDSGIGGLIFAIDIFFILEPLIKEINAAGINVEFNHIGDTANVPYGGKTVNQIKCLSAHIVNMSVQQGNAAIFMACNTMCSVFDDLSIDTLNKSDSSVKIISIIKKSAAKLLEIAQSSETNDAKKPSMIAVFGTKQTIKSNVYSSNIRSLSAAKKQIMNDIFCHAPNFWVQYVESGFGREESIVKRIESDMRFFHRLNRLDSVAKVNGKIAVGLFCTHYKVYRKEVKRFFESLNLNVDIVEQGNLFVEDVAKILNDFKADVYAKNKTANIIVNMKANINNIGYFKINSKLTSFNSAKKTKQTLQSLYEDSEFERLSSVISISETEPQ